MSENPYSEIQWQILDDEIQKRLRALAASLQAASPSCEPRFGKTVTKLFPLFSYVRFRRERADDIDLIVGIDLAPQDGQWRIDADISEEESGRIYFELPNPLIAVASFEELREYVLRTVDQLIVQGTPCLLRLFGTPASVLQSHEAGLSEVAPSEGY